MPKEDEVQRYVAYFEALRKKPLGYLDSFDPGITRNFALFQDSLNLAAARAAEMTAMAAALAVPPLPALDLTQQGLWLQFDPTGAKREAFRIVYGYLPSHPMDIEFLRLGRSVDTTAASSEPAIAENELTAGPTLGIGPASSSTEIEPANNAVGASSEPAIAQKESTAGHGEPVLVISDHERRVANVCRNFGGKDKPPYKEFYKKLKLSNSEFAAWRRGDPKHCGWAKRDLLDKAADKLT